MTFSLEFDQRALKEWHKLGDTVRQQFKKKLAEIRPSKVILQAEGIDHTIRRVARQRFSEVKNL